MYQAGKTVKVKKQKNELSKKSTFVRVPENKPEISQINTILKDKTQVISIYMKPYCFTPKVFLFRSALIIYFILLVHFVTFYFYPTTMLSCTIVKLCALLLVFFLCVYLGFLNTLPIKNLTAYQVFSFYKVGLWGNAYQPTLQSRYMPGNFL